MLIKQSAPDSRGPRNLTHHVRNICDCEAVSVTAAERLEKEKEKGKTFTRVKAINSGINKREMPLTLHKHQFKTAVFY